MCRKLIFPNSSFFLEFLFLKYCFYTLGTSSSVSITGNCIGFNGNYNGVYWYVMDSIGGMLNSIGKMPKTHNKNTFCNVLLEKANGV